MNGKPLGPLGILCMDWMDRLIEAVAREIAEEHVLLRDQPEQACMRSFATLKRAAECYEAWGRAHHQRTDLSEDEWARLMLEETREFWATIFACSAFAREMICAAADRGYPADEAVAS